MTVKYTELLEVTKYHLHAFELVVCYKALNTVLGNPRQAEEALFRGLGSLNAYSEWRDDILKHVKQMRSFKSMKSDYILYYTVAGVPIHTTIRSLKVSQARIYKVRNTPVHEIVKKTRMEGFFIDHPVAITNLNRLVKRLKLFDGYTILDR